MAGNGQVTMRSWTGFLAGGFLFLVGLSWGQGATVAVRLGEEVEAEGVVVERKTDRFVLRSYSGADYVVRVSPATEIKEKKKNPFRAPDRYRFEDVTAGLRLRVEGRGDLEGAVLARKIEFTRDDLLLAQAITGSLDPVEARLAQADRELDETRRRFEGDVQTLGGRADRLESQVSELGDAVRETAEQQENNRRLAEVAVRRAEAAHSRLDHIDDYRLVRSETVYFGFNAASLSPEAKERLRLLAAEVSGLPGVLIEVAGYASADGDGNYNRRLSQRRAEAVVRFLVDEAGVPLRRLIPTWGYGESRPIADNERLEGRKRNRRVEVLVWQNQAAAPEDAGSRQAKVRPAFAKEGF
ncbi:MAG: hypothetical protein Kow00109_30060 [Acidobacteriota bacterium]